MKGLSRKYRTALVTGGTSGLGLAFCEMLVAEGVKTFSASRFPSKLPSISGLHGLELDLADLTSVAAFARRFVGEQGVPDLLINNAGITRDGLLLRMNEEDWDEDWTYEDAEPWVQEGEQSEQQSEEEEQDLADAVLDEFREALAGALAALWPFRRSETIGDDNVGIVRVDLDWINPPTDLNTMWTLIAFLVGSGLVVAFIKYDQAKAQKKGG